MVIFVRSTAFGRSPFNFSVGSTLAGEFIPWVLSLLVYIITLAMNPFSIFVEKLLCGMEKATHTRRTSTLLGISQWVLIRILFSTNPYDINKGSVKITSLQLSVLDSRDQGNISR